jgi:hypothetical protein
MAERKRNDSKLSSGHSAVTGLSSRVTPAFYRSALTHRPPRLQSLASPLPGTTRNGGLPLIPYPFILFIFTPPPPYTTSSLLNFLQRSSLSILPYREAPASYRPAFTHNIADFVSQFGGSLPVRNRSPPWNAGGLLTKKEGGPPLSRLTAKSAGRCPVKG